MDGAERIIQRLLLEAKAYRDRSSFLNLHDSPAVSGTYPLDYPLQASYERSVPTLPVVGAVHTVPLPLQILDHFDPMQNPDCMMGVFPEISQAWLVINSHFFLWNFQNGRNLISFDGLRDSILCAGLVRPKEGLLQPHIAYLLVIATPVQVVMLGVTVTSLQTGDLHNRTTEEIQLLTEPMYLAAADDMYISVTGTHNGRIFLSGHSGSLYEVVYQAKAGWLSPKSWIINHSKGMASVLLTSMRLTKYDPIAQVAVDNSRNILYTFSENGVLQVYDLGQDGNGIRKVTSISQDTIVSSATDIAKTVDDSAFKPIVQIAVIEESKSAVCHLVAVTRAGVRLYFTTAPLQQPTAQPCGLTLVHVRMPPGFTSSASVEKPSNVHKVLYSDGVFLMAASTDDDCNLLWCINHDPKRFQLSPMEMHSKVPMDGYSCALASFTDSSTTMERRTFPAKKFVVLSAYGSHIFSMVTPVEQLQHLVCTYEDGGEQNIEQFFKLYQRDQACAVTLQLACSTFSSERKLSVWATQAFFSYGGIAPVKMNPSLAPHNNIRAIFYSSIPVGPPLHTGNQALNLSFLASLGQPCYLPVIIFSAGHNGIYIHFTRIIQSIWDKELTAERKFKVENCDVTEIHSRVSSQVLKSVLQDLGVLQEFLDRNFQFGTGSLQDIRCRYKSTIPHGNRVTTGTRQKLKNIGDHQELHDKPQSAEITSIQELHQLVRKSIQILALWNLLCGSHFHQVVSELHTVLQEQLKKTTFKDLLLRNQELTRALISSLITWHIRHNLQVDEVISSLQRACPLFYSTEDAIFTKANLQRSLQAQNKHDKDQMLRVSLQEYKKVGHLIDLANICGQYRQEHFYEGVVDLCLASAEKKDPAGLGLLFLRNGKPKGDAAGLQASEDRTFCYKIILDSLQEVVNQMKYPPPTAPLKLDPGHHLKQILIVSQRSSDEFFHIVLFNWLIQADLTDILVELKSPFLEAHLLHISNRRENQVATMNLLYRYYQKNGNYISAARVMAKLAVIDNTAVTLKRRIEYLSRAILSAKTTNSMDVPAQDKEFIHELEDYLDVAKIQLEIQGTLSRQFSHLSSTQKSVAQLDSEIMDLTELYEKFAHPFQLSECKLKIIQCAECFSDVFLVKNIWKEIIQRELKDSVKMAAADRMQMLSLKLISLGKIFSSTPRCFPVRFLVNYLEQQVCTLDWPAGFVTKTMLEMTVLLPRLFAVYDDLFRYRNDFWTEMKNSLHLAECIHGLLSGYVNGIITVPVLERHQFNTTCVSAISSYLVELQSMDPTPAVKTSLWNFKHLQTGLEQLL
ncbi:nuclear pore complex protein Nup155-like [Bufo bufo]|uniref:nuclear pore complex protein Nup155-like n=1 Tax=Bufo bufo TaxID=8384 RepID=UPI001ABE19E3|nr:nuclear pore complex protein Nup155-like [Bufo bufo]